MTDEHQVQSAASLADAYAMLAQRSDVKVIAGGTDLMVLMNARSLDAGHFLDIWGLEELRGITDQGPSLRIGALSTFAELGRSPLVLQHMPALAAASGTVGAVQIQNRATIGGNVVNASPAGSGLRSFTRATGGLCSAATNWFWQSGSQSSRPASATILERSEPAAPRPFLKLSWRVEPSPPKAVSTESASALAA